MQPSNFIEHAEFHDQLQFDSDELSSGCDHDLIRTTALGDTEETYICSKCDYTETEPMQLHVPKLNGGW